MPLNDNDYLTAKRFESSIAETRLALKKLSGNATIDKALLEKIEAEDFLLEVKLRSYETNIRKIVLCTLLIAISAAFYSEWSFMPMFLLLGIVFFISSLFGILHNRITPLQKKYLKN